jgi:hypothetical protein
MHLINRVIHISTLKKPYLSMRCFVSFYKTKGDNSGGNGDKGQLY